MALLLFGFIFLLFFLCLEQELCRNFLGIWQRQQTSHICAFFVWVINCKNLTHTGNTMYYSRKSVSIRTKESRGRILLSEQNKIIKKFKNRSIHNVSKRRSDRKTINRMPTYLDQTEKIRFDQKVSHTFKHTKNQIRE